VFKHHTMQQDRCLMIVFAQDWCVFCFPWQPLNTQGSSPWDKNNVEKLILYTILELTGFKMYIITQLQNKGKPVTWFRRWLLIIW
jgi:hypothetical protein